MAQPLLGGPRPLASLWLTGSLARSSQCFFSAAHLGPLRIIKYSIWRKDAHRSGVSASGQALGPRTNDCSGTSCRGGRTEFLQVLSSRARCLRIQRCLRPRCTAGRRQTTQLRETVEAPWPPEHRFSKGEEAAADDSAPGGDRGLPRWGVRPGSNRQPAARACKCFLQP